MFSLINVSASIARSKRPRAMSSFLVSATTFSPPLSGLPPVIDTIASTAREFQLRTIPTRTDERNDLHYRVEGARYGISFGTAPRTLRAATGSLGLLSRLDRRA